MLPYFENLVFLCTSKKYITPDIGYDGVIGLRPVGWMPPSPKRRQPVKQTKDVDEWVPESPLSGQDQQDWSPDDAAAAIARSEELEHEADEAADALGSTSIIGSVSSSMDMDVELGETGEDSNLIEISVQEELDAIGAMVEGEDASVALVGECLESGDQLDHAAGISSSQELHIIETEADKEKGICTWSQFMLLAR